MINFAHRGASHYAPENTMISFHLGLKMNANGIETDVQKTKDNVLVLFHDSDMKRIFSVDGKISEYTLEELKKLDAGRYKGEEFSGEKIVTLEEFLKEFGNKGIHLAIEIKQQGIEKETLDMVRKYVSDENFTITSFIYDAIENLSKSEKIPQLGFLTREYSEELLDKIASMNIVEYCPSAEILTDEILSNAKKRGLRVRAWGVKDINLMEKMVGLGVFGMTVNFPDELDKRLKNVQC